LSFIACTLLVYFVYIYFLVLSTIIVMVSEHFHFGVCENLKKNN